jgi:hypothetical protein
LYNSVRKGLGWSVSDRLSALIGSAAHLQLSHRMSTFHT